MAADSTIRPDFQIEREERARLGGHVAGVDEAGRGPLAGPVVAAAVILDPEAIPDGIDDSKRLTPDRREELFVAIRRSALAVGVGIADVGRIDSINILRATLWAMSESVRGLQQAPCIVLVDGNMLPQLDVEGRAIVGGDARCLSIAAASIVAKVTRDRMMVELADAFPGYGFEQHKGYATQAHRDAIRRLGVTPHHRQTFRTVQLAIAGRDEAISLAAASGPATLAP